MLAAEPGEKNCLKMLFRASATDATCPLLAGRIGYRLAGCAHALGRTYRQHPSYRHQCRWLRPTSTPKWKAQRSASVTILAPATTPHA